MQLDIQTIITINASVLRCTIVEIVIVILFVAFVILQLILWDFRSLMQKDINGQNGYPKYSNHCNFISSIMSIKIRIPINIHSLVIIQ